MANSLNKSHLRLSLRVQHLMAALLLFTLLYTLNNEYSAAVFNYCSDCVHSLATTLDSNIVFIPAMIVPYSWSLILFMASFFMVRTKLQLSVLTYRLIVATLLASIVFYLYPAQFSSIRPITTDWTAFGYWFLSITDKPYNQFPSLHVSYALLLGYSLWGVFDDSNNNDGNKRWVFTYRLVLLLICTLIILSTVFTYQHHLLDIIGGLALAAVVLVIVDKITSGLVIRYLTIGISGFLLIAIAGFFWRKHFNSALLEYVGLALALYWLASFMCLAWIYQVTDVAHNKRWFQKDAIGHLCLSTWLTFAPILVAYKAMSAIGQIYANHKSVGEASKIAWHTINDDMLISATPRMMFSTLIRYHEPLYDGQMAHIRQPVLANKYQLIVIDVAAEVDSHFKTISALAAKTSMESMSCSSHYLYLPLLDLQPFSRSDLPLFIAFFEQVDRLINVYAEKNSAVQSAPVIYINVHCVMGLSRSIAVQVLYLVYCDKLSVSSYQAWINKHYPHARVSLDYLPKSLVMAMSDAKNNNKGNI